MSAIREWSTAICLAALVAALAQGLVPGGSMERMEKFVIGAFIVCALIAPLSRAVPRLALALNGSGSAAGKETSSRLESTVDDQMRSAARKSIASLTASELARMNLRCKNVQVDMDTNEGGSISISKVTVTLDKKDAARCREAQEALTAKLGIRTEVVVDGG